MIIADGTLARESTRPEVWFIESSKRRWVPDSPTVDSLGGWNTVQLVRPPDIIENQVGPMWPSVVNPGKWDDGSLIQAAPSPNVYVMEGGLKRWIPDPRTFEHQGYRWNDVQQISTVEMNAILTGDDIPRYKPAQASRYEIHTGPMNLGANHWMETDTRLTIATGEVTGKTRTKTGTTLGGFHGACKIIFSDEDDIPVPNGQSPIWRYGVDGSWIGNSDRTDAFTWNLDVGSAQRVRDLTVFHTWAPNEFQTAFDQWMANFKKVKDLISSSQGVSTASKGTSA